VELKAEANEQKAAANETALTTCVRRPEFAQALNETNDAISDVVTIGLNPLRGRLNQNIIATNTLTNFAADQVVPAVHELQTISNELVGYLETANPPQRHDVLPTVLHSIGSVPPSSFPPPPPPPPPPQP
jgi:hypothetical protein